MMMSMVPQLRLNTCLATVWVYEPRVPASLARFECDSLYDSLVTAYLASLARSEWNRSMMRVARSPVTRARMLASSASPPHSPSCSQTWL